MNATGDSDTRNYYDRLQADQKVTHPTAALHVSMRCCCVVCSVIATKTFTTTGQPLWQMDEEQKAAVALAKAQAHKIDVDNGLINPEVLREARANQLIEDGFYPGIESAIDEFELEPDEEDEAAHAKLDLQMKQQGLTNMKKPMPMQKVGGLKRPAPPQLMKK